LDHTAGDDVLDARGIDAGAVDQRTQDLRVQRDRMQAVERPARSARPKGERTTSITTARRR